jgi:hypothetical protein
MSMKVMNAYREPMGLPLYWQNEATGVLQAAIRAYLDNRVESKPIPAEQFELVRAYMEYVVNAPCWGRNTMIGLDHKAAEILDGLKRDVIELKNPDDIAGWIHRCMEIGIDPL